jgi:hypothetical protein
MNGWTAHFVVAQAKSATMFNIRRDNFFAWSFYVEGELAP